MYHNLIIVGNLGRDPEMRYTPGGQTVTSFPVATNRQYTASDGTQVKETIWFRITVWGRMAEVCNQYLSKGRSVLIEGRLNPDPETGGPKVWQGQSGPGASYEVTANTVKFLSGRGDETSYQSEGSHGQVSDEGDAIPF